MQTCMVCMYVCVHIGVHCWQDGVSLRGRNTDGNPAWVCRTETLRMGLSRVLLLPSWGQGDLSNRSPICRGVHVYAFAHVHTWVHLYAWMWVRTEWRYMDIEGLKGEKRGPRIDTAKWMYVQRLGLCKDTRWHQVCDTLMTPTNQELLALENLELLKISTDTTFKQETKKKQKKTKRTFWVIYIYLSWRFYIHIHWWDAYS